MNGKDKSVNKDLVRCNLCTDSFETDKGLKIHISRKHSSRDSQTSSATKQGATAQVKGNDKQLFPCVVCTHSFDTERGLNIHITRKHSSRNQDLRQECSDKKHDSLKQIKDKNKEKFVCTVCADSFETEKGLNIHFSRKHSSEDSAVKQEPNDLTRNSQNNQTFRQDYSKDEQNLPINDNNYALQHTFPCIICARTFGSERGLKIHITRSHTEEPNFSNADIPNDDERPDDQTDVSPSIEELVINKKEVSQVAVEMQKFMAAFQYVLKDKSPHLNWKTFNSGSYYDKTKNTHADEFDIMIYLDNVQVEVDFDDRQVSGFYKVKLISPRVRTELQDTVDKDGYVIPAMFKRYVFGLFDEVFKDTTHREMRRVKRKEKPDDSSPAYTIYYNSIPERPIDIDLVPCFRIDGWPAIARDINPKWITNDKIVNESIRYYDVVCKTCPDAVPNKELLWRLSFSYTEKKLIMAANDGSKFSTKKMVFRFIKKYIQDAKDKYPQKVKKFCSYHVKQFMLHQFDIWEEHDIVHTQRLLLEKLIDTLTKPSPCIENYFIENDNVIRYVPKSEIDLVVQCLKKEFCKLQQKHT